MTTTIIASDAEVRAWLGGATSFRRPVKLRGICPACMGASVPHPVMNGRPVPYLRVPACEHNDVTGKRVTPPWKPSDVLRVREAHQFIGFDMGPVIAFRATCPDSRFNWVHDDGLIEQIQVHRWRPASQMSAVDSRMSIRVTGVGIERGDVWEWVVNFERVEVV